MQVFQARAVRLGAVARGLAGIVVGGYVTFWFLDWAYVWAFRHHSFSGSAVLVLLALVTPAAATSRWRSSRGQGTFEKALAASVAALPVALLVGFAVVVWSLASGPHI